MTTTLGGYTISLRQERCSQIAFAPLGATARSYILVTTAYTYHLSGRTTLAPLSILLF